MRNEKQKEIWLDPEELQRLLEGGLYWKDIEPKIALENTDSFKRQFSIDGALNDSEVFAEGMSSTEIEVPLKDEEDAYLFTDDAADDEVDAEELRAILLGDKNAAKDELQALFISQAAALEEDFSRIGQDEVNWPLESKAESVAVVEKDEAEIGEYDRSEIKAELIDWDHHPMDNGGDQSDIENTLVMGSLTDFLKVEDTEVGKEERSSFSNLNNVDKKGEKLAQYTDNDDDDDDLEYKEKSSFGGLIVVGLIVIVALATFGLWYFFIAH